MLADLRFALRQLRKTPGFTLVALSTLALGIGATTAIFSVVNTVLLRPLEYRNPDELVTLWSFNTKRASRYAVSGPDFRDWQEQCRSFSSVARFMPADVSTVVGDHAAEKTPLGAVSADFFRVLAVSPRAGRVFTADEAVSGTVAIVGEAFARRHFPGDPVAALEATIHVRGKPLRIIGVIPAGIAFPERAEIWVPLNTLFGESLFRSAHNYRVIARLGPGSTLRQAQAEMDGIAARLAKEYPDSNTNKGARLVPLRDLLTHQHKSTLWTLFGAVALVLLIACANVANLLLARGARRTHEIALRAALGASRIRIARQLLGESLLLALFGGGAGVLLAKAALVALLALAPAGLSRVDEIGLDGGTLAFALLVSFFVCVLTGLFPAFQAARVDLNTALHAGGRGVTGGRSRMRSALVVAQLAVSLVLLAGAGLLLRSLQLLLAVDPGYRPGQVLVMEASFPSAGNDGATRAVAFYEEFCRQAGAQPGVTTLSFTHSLPVDSHGTSNGTYAVEGLPRPSPADAAKFSSSWRVVGSNYFSTLGIPVRAGRELDARDAASAPLTVVINESMARAGWPNESPLGHRISIGWDALDQWMTIVGVVADTKAGSLDAPSRQELYVPAAQHPKIATDMKIVARIAIEPLALVETFRRIARQLDPAVPVKFTTAEALVAGTAATPRFRSLLIGILAVVALVVAAIGLYSVLAYGVAQRTAEIGIRMALGAQRTQVLALILRGGFKLVAIGIAVGLIAAIASTRLIETMLFGVRPLDPVVYGAVAALFLAIAALACWLPAHRATKVDPLVALRAE